MRLASTFATLITSASLILGVTGCSEETEPVAQQPQQSTIVDVAVKAGSFTTLVSALKATGLDKTLAGPGPFTVFAPTDAAFALLPAGVLAGLDAATTSKILGHHVYAGSAPASAVVGLTSVATVSGESVAVAVRGGSVYLDEVAKVVTTDIAADNGIIHVIDAVLLPPSIAFPGTVVDALKASPNFSSLVGAVVRAELAATLSGDNMGAGFTVFAPTNAAFAALGVDVTTMDKAALAQVLLYHVASGKVPASQVVGLKAAPTLAGSDVSIDVASGSVVLNGKSKVVRTDLKTSNGIIHIIDAVLTP